MANYKSNAEVEEMPILVKRESSRDLSKNQFFTFTANKTNCKRAKMADSEETSSLETTKPSNSKKSTFIAIHLGAGKHSSKKENEYKILCKQAITKAVKILSEGGTAGAAVTCATTILEDCELVNAGYGSNLTMDKTVECDAAFMNGSQSFGAVGAIPETPNPILVAKRLADLHEEKPMLSCGRVPPNFLVGSGAREWAKSQGISVCDGTKLISEKAKTTYKKHMNNVHNSEVCNHVNDTVGAIALDQSGSVAATVSSGGNWLKFPGRLGHAPIYGSGCWASNSDVDCENDSSVALSLSGSGEILAKLHLAQDCGSALGRSTCSVVDLSSLITKRISDVKIHTEPGYTGLIALRYDGSFGEFLWGHNSESFIIAYGGSSFKSVKVNFTKSLQPSGRSISLEAIPFR